MRDALEVGENELSEAAPGPWEETSSEAELPGIHPAEEAGGWY